MKWLGGKARLAGTVLAGAPLDDPEVTRYVEPFVGGGAVLWALLGRYEPEQVVIADLNAELMNLYRVVRDRVDELIAQLAELDDAYQPMSDDARAELFYTRREEFNLVKGAGGVREAALMLFLNKTCFNGLYRVNSNGLFNAPAGVYKHPSICNAAGLRTCSALLANVDIVCADYHDVLRDVGRDTWVYLDPPYRPLKETSFTAYTEGKFTVDDQRELGRMITQLTAAGARVTLSNSDPANVDVNDHFFSDLFTPEQGYTIAQVHSRHFVGRNASSRAPLTELLITNFAQ